ncbi:hypothetical protein H4Q26_007155 [Puccinia striiformis f. sp. tritici PST-130]|nr:hypothetical protein H4Q26_007155 [Puccinia striiformis f. sp. tritici PST-130]
MESTTIIQRRLDLILSKSTPQTRSGHPTRYQQTQSTEHSSIPRIHLIRRTTDSAKRFSDISTSSSTSIRIKTIIPPPPSTTTETTSSGRVLENHRLKRIKALASLPPPPPSPLPLPAPAPAPAATSMSNLSHVGKGRSHDEIKEEERVFDGHHQQQNQQEGEEEGRRLSNEHFYHESQDIEIEKRSVPVSKINDWELDEMGYSGSAPRYNVPNLNPNHQNWDHPHYQNWNHPQNWDHPKSSSSCLAGFPYLTGYRLFPPAAVAWPEPGTPTKNQLNQEKKRWASFNSSYSWQSCSFKLTFILGSLPLYLSTSLSPARFHQLSIFSVGLLIGAALTIVIPEGIDTIYSSTIIPTSSANQTIQHDLNQQQHHHHSAIGLSLMGGFMLMFLIDQITRIPNLKNKSTLVPAVPKQSDQIDEKEGAGWNQDDRASKRSFENNGDDDDDDDNQVLNANSPHEEEVHNNRQKKTKNSRIQSNSFSTVIGLLTHSLADGIALGASSVPITTPIPTSKRNGKESTAISLQFIIFLAIMVHKAPAAFGMVSVLLSEGLSKKTVRKILLGFSLAAPMGALLTYLGLTILNKLMHSSSPADVIGGNLADISPDIVHYGFKWWIGVTLLFSGGTFLFVATHALQTSSSSDVHRVIDPCCPIPQSSELLSSPEPELPAHSSSPSDKHSSALVGLLSRVLLWSSECASLSLLLL